MLNYHELSSSPHLKPYLRKYWVLDNLSSSLATETQYALPNTCFTIAFVCGNGLVINQDGSSNVVGEGVFIAGQISVKTGVSLLPHTKAFMVQLNAQAAPLLTNCPFYQLTNSFASVTDLNKVLARKLNGINLWDSSTLKREVEKALSGFLNPSKASALITAGLNEMQKNTFNNNFSINHLSAQLGCSPRVLEKQFRQHVGLSPKQTQIILKVRSVVDELQLAHSGNHLTQVAYRYGYFDQAHFIKTFKSVINTTPAKFDKQQYLLPFST